MQELSSDIAAIFNGAYCGLLACNDNIHFLRTYASELRGRISCVYIDPPYRNGDAYAHYADELGHEEWLSYMSELLPLLYDTLNDKGSIWISIDDAEFAYLKILCDKLFEAEAFQAAIVWEHRKTRENRAAFSHNHEYLLCYAKDAQTFREHRHRIPCPKLLAKYSNPDGDPRGPWQSITATAPSGHSVPTQFYDVISPSTGKVHRPPKGRCWVYNEARMRDEISQGRIYFGKDGNGAPRIKKYLSEAELSLVPETLWKAEDVGTTASAKKHILTFNIPTEAVFETPKPEELLHRIIEIATDPGDTVLDVFMGSGTTASACHKTGRHYLGVDSSPASFLFASKRIDAVIAGESGGISKTVNWQGGGNVIRAIAPGE